MTAAQEALAQQQAKLASMQAAGSPRRYRGRAGRRSPPSRPSSTCMLHGGRPEAVAEAQAGARRRPAEAGAAARRAPPTTCARRRSSAVNADTAQVASAEAAYAALGGTSSADLQSLQNQVDTLDAQVAAAQSAVSSADAALDQPEGSSAADVQAAQTAYDQAQAQLSAAQAAVTQANNPTQAVDRAGPGGGGAGPGPASRGRSKPDGARAEGVPACARRSLSPLNGGLPAAQRHRVQRGQGRGGLGDRRRQRVGRGGAGPARPAEARRRPGASKLPLQAQFVSAQALVKATKARLDALSNGGVAGPARAAPGPARPGRRAS